MKIHNLGRDEEEECGGKENDQVLLKTTHRFQVDFVLNS